MLCELMRNPVHEQIVRTLVSSEPVEDVLPQFAYVIP
jgi:hypothetical protein